MFVLNNKTRKTSFYHYMIRRLFFFLAAIALLLTACKDNDTFSTDRSHRLTFSTDTVRLDTLFSQVPSVTKTFWVFNHSGDGIRIRTVRLDRGNQSGFRVNVDGTFLDPVASDFEVRKGDSIRVFVEITSHENLQAEAQLVEDNLIFLLESGVEQRVNLRTYSWDALKLTNKEVASDEVLTSTMPVVIYGQGITVNEGATLTIRDTELYFHDGAGISVSGKLILENVLLRGDRLDRMFAYLPYDRVSGQWKGITLNEGAAGIVMTDSELRSANTGILATTTNVELTNSIIHNCKGHGLYAYNTKVSLQNCLLSNCLNDCLSLHGGYAEVNATTLAQFYPYSGNRGAALRFSNTKEEALSLSCSNMMATGYEDDEVFKDNAEGIAVEEMEYTFSNCLLRTGAVDDPDIFTDIIWEKPSDPIQGKLHFKLFDDTNFIYDFHVKEESPCFEKHIGWIGNSAE